MLVASLADDAGTTRTTLVSTASEATSTSGSAPSGEVAEHVVIEVVALGEREAIVRAKGGQTLAAGDAVVIRGNERVRPGQPVTRRDAEAAKAEAPSGAPTPAKTSPTELKK